MSNPVILEMKGIVKSFGPVKALKGVENYDKNNYSSLCRWFDN